MSELGGEKEPRPAIDWSLFRAAPDHSLALYDDDSGVYLGTISPAQYRTLRKYFTSFDDDIATTIVTADDLARVRQLSFGSELLDRLERRVRFHGPLKMRRVKIAVPAI